MPRRPVFAANTPADALYAWIANAVGEVFTTPRVLPILRRPPAEPPPSLPLLFEDLPDQRRGEPPPVPPAPEPEPAVALDPRDFPNAALMRRIIGDVLPPPSELTIRRRRLKRERAEAQVAPAAAEFPEADAVPEHRAFTKEEAAAVEHLAWGKAHSVPGEHHRKAWDAFIARGRSCPRCPCRCERGTSPRSA